jgi:hypothetical protein
MHNVVQPNGQLSVSLCTLPALAATNFRRIRVACLALRRAASLSVHCMHDSAALNAHLQEATLRGVFVNVFVLSSRFAEEDGFARLGRERFELLEQQRQHFIMLGNVALRQRRSQ